MHHFETLIREVQVVDGTGAPSYLANVALQNGKIAAIHHASAAPVTIHAKQLIDGTGLVLSPGFIDAHTHDDTMVIRQPQMLPKLSQGVTTVIVGNCGISASPFTLSNSGSAPDPMQLLGPDNVFCYPRFIDYRNAIKAAQPAVNVAAMIGHTALRSNHMDHLNRSATAPEIKAMCQQLAESLQAGAAGLSTGLAYASAQAATTEEVKQLAQELSLHGGVYTTHLRSEFETILDAMEEAFDIGRSAKTSVVVSHLKCAGIANWGRSTEILSSLEQASRYQAIGCDCYPYTASSSTLDLKQVTDEFEIFITWSDAEPSMAGQTLQAIADQWKIPLIDAAKRLQPAGAIYHCMESRDVERILAHPLTMIGSDGLPEDPHPHPRLWGTFPRVIGHYSRTLNLFPLTEAVRKMTSLPAQRFHLTERGKIETGYWADLVLFDPETISDTASFSHPERCAAGIHSVWVNGVLSFTHGKATQQRAGRFLAHNTHKGK